MSEKSRDNFKKKFKVKDSHNEVLGSKYYRFNDTRNILENLRKLNEQKKQENKKIDKSRSK
jgi:hypothetical protein